MGLALSLNVATEHKFLDETGGYRAANQHPQDRVGPWPAGRNDSIAVVKLPLQKPIRKSRASGALAPSLAEGRLSSASKCSWSQKVNRKRGSTVSSHRTHHRFDRFVGVSTKPHCNQRRKDHGFRYSVWPAVALPRHGSKCAATEFQVHEILPQLSHYGALWPKLAC